MILKPSLNMIFNPEVWRPYRETSVCFSYALNSPNLGRANIGGLNEKVADWRTPDSIADRDLVIARGVKDGLIPQDERDFDPKKEHIIATFTGVVSWEAEVYDCHHVRLDGDGSYSDKNGNGEPERYIIPVGMKASDCLLTEYSKIRLESYFISFFKVPDNGVSAMPRLSEL